MSDDSKQPEPWRHPLLPWLTGIAVNTFPFVPYAPLEGIQEKIDHAVVELADARWGEDEAKRQIRITYNHAAAALHAIALAGGSELDGHELHALLFVAAQGDPLAHAFCDAAGYALLLDLLPEFAVATRLPGFKDALEQWAHSFGYHLRFDGSKPKQLKFINREMVQKDEPCANFWLTACQNDFPSPKEFLAKLAKEQFLFTDAKRHTPKPKQEPARFKDLIQFGWLPASLWARTHAGIVHFFQPRATGAVEAAKRVMGDVSVLKFSRSHRGEWQEAIDQARDPEKNISAEKNP